MTTTTLSRATRRRHDRRTARRHRVAERAAILTITERRHGWDRPTGRLADVWNESTRTAERFCTLVAAVLRRPDVLAVCEDCDEPAWRDDGSYYASDFICEDCISNNYFTCYSCDEIERDHRSCSVEGENWCEDCSQNAYYCEPCGEMFSSPCDSHDDERCDCEAPVRRFSFPANGAGTISEDERLTVELPAGTISEEGVRAIYRLVNRELYGTPGARDVPLEKIITELDPRWQTKRGNYTRRLSAALHAHGVKLLSATISEVGNLARQHTSDSSSWQVEVTRDLNLSAADFYHEDSCWFTGGEYAVSRCCLKHWGGLGLRTFNAYGTVTGRAWVQPLDERYQPTHDTIGAHAYAVYNGYGDLNGYVAARIVAHLTGRTYRKVSLDIGGQYVNGETGYLVAADGAPERVSYGHDIDPHDNRDAYRPRQTSTRDDMRASA